MKYRVDITGYFHRRRPDAAHVAADALQLIEQRVAFRVARVHDKDARAALKSKLTDRSLHGRARLAGAAADRLRRLQGVDRARLDPAAQIDLGVAETAHRLAVDHGAV